MQVNPYEQYETAAEPQELLARVVRNVEKVIVGKREQIELALIALLCGGHLLLEDVPGVGKTMLVKSLARTIGAGFRRIQFTPDLLPSDVTGVSVYNQRSGEFEFRPGPIMSQIVLADEINRTSPKTQSALLEAMEERQVTVDGTTYRLPELFCILATQNPYEYAGTFALPEVQLDRFLIKLRLGYPHEPHEAQMLAAWSAGGRDAASAPETLKPVMAAEELVRMQRRAALVHVDPSIQHYIVRLANLTRRSPELLLGASPRASIALMRTAQARAFMQGRSYVLPDDVKAMLLPTWSHRLMLKQDAKMRGRTNEELLQAYLSQTPVPGLQAAPAAARER